MNAHQAIATSLTEAAGYAGMALVSLTVFVGIVFLFVVVTTAFRDYSKAKEFRRNLKYRHNRYCDRNLRK